MSLPGLRHNGYIASVIGPLAIVLLYTRDDSISLPGPAHAFSLRVLHRSSRRGGDRETLALVESILRAPSANRPIRINRPTPVHRRLYKGDVAFIYKCFS